EAKIIAALDGEDVHYLAMETALPWRLTPFGFRSRPPMERAIIRTQQTTSFGSNGRASSIPSKVWTVGLGRPTCPPDGGANGGSLIR
ncbi:MAG: hypothetical protein NTV46_01135, partial [Verrucomicrobia bacterium]|nr:hypothetical protein [Verrucomicrobiota bacterium]